MKLGRREALFGLAGTGIALVTRRGAAEPITTDDKGLSAGMVKVRELPAYRAMPEGAGPFPAIVVVQGLAPYNDYFKDLCRRFAKEGYYAIAPAFFGRFGDAATMPFAGMPAMARALPDAQVMADLDATIAYAKASGKVDGDRVGLNGFSWGAWMTWLAATRPNAPKACVAWYAPLTSVKGGPLEVNPVVRPKAPMDVVGSVRSPVLGIYGADDPLAADVKTFQPKLPKGSEIAVYPAAGHAFHADRLPAYAKSAAEEGWMKALSWFKSHGV